jgi:4-amino-4-deoxy-L-arabinose transferase-like glycosyltransferase
MGIVAVVLLLIIALRIVYLDADPPPFLDWSGGYVADEMALAHNARNKVLFGQWITDEWNPLFYTPLLTLLEYVSFSLFGVGLKSLRLVNVLFISLGLVLFYWTMREGVGKKAALLSLILLGFNFIFLSYSRLGLNDVFLIFPMFCTLFFWQKGLKDRPWLPWAGISAFACYVTKATALYFVHAAFLSLIYASFRRYLETRDRKEAVLSPLYFLGGLMMAYLGWRFFFYSPNRAVFTSVSKKWFHLALPHNRHQFLADLSWPVLIDYLSWTPVELILGLSFVPVLLWALVRDWKKIRPIEVLTLLWLLGGYLMINGLNYRPVRYFIPLLPPICILAALALDRLWDKTSSGEFSLKGLGLAVICGIWTLALVRYGYRFHPGMFNKILLGGGVLTGLLLILFPIWKNSRGLSGFIPGGGFLKALPRTMATVLLLLFLAVNGLHAWRFFHDPQYKVRDTSRELGRILDRAMIAGLWAPLATIENGHRSLYVGNLWFNYRKTFDRFPVTHLFLWDGNHREEERFISKAYPEVWARAILVKTYSIKDLPVRLYQLSQGKF